MNLRLIRQLKNSRATSNRFGINILLQSLMNTHLTQIVSIVSPGFCSFLLCGVRAGSPCFRGSPKSLISFDRTTRFDINIFSAIFSRIKLGLANTMWMVHFMLVLRWNACEIWSIQMMSEPYPFIRLFWHFSLLLQVKYSIPIHS